MPATALRDLNSVRRDRSRIAPSRPQARPYDRRSPDDRRWTIDDRRSVPTGIADLDARLDGGLPRGHLSEVIGPRSSGRLAILVSALAGATARGEAVALIDPLDMFDPVSASASGDRFHANVVGARRGVQFGARQPLVRIRHAAEGARSGGEGAESRTAGGRIWTGRCWTLARLRRRPSSGCHTRPGCACIE